MTTGMISGLDFSLLEGKEIKCVFTTDLNLMNNLPLTGCLVSILHGPEQVSTWTQHPEDLWKGVRIDLARSKPIGHQDHIVGVIVDRNGTKLVYGGVDVVLVGVLFPCLKSILNQYYFLFIHRYKIMM